MAIMGGPIARESLTVRAWGATCVYTIIYGVAFVFLVGPATQQLAVLGDPAAQRTITYALWLVTAVVLTVGAGLLSYTLDLMLDRHYIKHEAPTWRVDVAFAVRGAVFALVAAGLFIVIASLALGGAVPVAVMWTAVLAFVIPGLVAGAMTHLVLPTVLAERKQMVVATGFAFTVVGLANYVLLGASQPLMVAAGA